MAGAVFGANQYIDSKLAGIKRVSVATAAPSVGGVNYLIVGSDSRAFVNSAAAASAFGDPNSQTGQRSDTMMVLHAEGSQSYVVSFPRDLWVTIPGHGDMKLNAAFNDGPQEVIDTLKADFNVDIQHYLEFNFPAFQDIVNAVGSVPVYFPYPARDQYSGLGPTLVAGCYHLDGPSALAYVRARHLEYYENGRWVASDPLSDLDRIQRQQNFIKKLGAIAVRQTLSDPFLAPGLVDHIIPNLTADPGFDRAAFNQLVQAFKGLAQGTGGPIFTTLPWGGPTTRGGGQSVLLVKHPDADAVLAVLRGQAPIPSPTTTPTSTNVATASPVSPANVRVAVFNGSGVQGAAGTASNAFNHLGFATGSVRNNPAGLVQHSEVRYAPSAEAKAQLVARYITGAQLVTDPTLSNTDIVVVIGKNFTGVATTTTTSPPAAPTSANLSPEAACN
jgi:polyisoprenyl-teichoic acid--peptidoglycan teichoic acid transferase